MRPEFDLLKYEVSTGQETQDDGTINSYGYVTIKIQMGLSPTRN
jgi:hypothetical protein